MDARIEENRLDELVLDSKPYEMALPTPRMRLLAKYLRPALSLIQCGIIGLGFIAAVLHMPPVPLMDRSIMLLLTLLYWAVYVLRLRPHSNKRVQPEWQRRQVWAGFAEFFLLLALGILYQYAGVNQTVFWWALFILPTYRLAEIGRVGFCPVGALAVAAYLGYAAPRGSLGWASSLSVLGILLMFTLLPYYLYRRVDLGREAARFWYPISLLFFRQSDLSSAKTFQVIEELSDSEKPLVEVFFRGADELVVADQAILWEPTTSLCGPELTVRYRYRRKRGPHRAWERFSDIRAPGQGELTLEPKHNPKQESLDAWPAPEQGSNFIAHSSTNGHGTPDGPWILPHDHDLHGWLVIPIYLPADGRLAAVLELGMGWPPAADDWRGIEIQTRAIAEALGAIYERIRRSDAETLYQAVAGIHRASAGPVQSSRRLDEAVLYKQAATQMTQYFKQPVLIIDYSFVAGGIGAQAGELESKKRLTGCRRSCVGENSTCAKDKRSPSSDPCHVPTIGFRQRSAISFSP